MGPDYISEAVMYGKQALIMSLKLSLPLLLVGTIVGVIISILQAATQVQEQTLTFVPKIIAVVAALFIGLPWFLNQMIHYTVALIQSMGQMFR